MTPHPCFDPRGMPPSNLSGRFDTAAEAGIPPVFPPATGTGLGAGSAPPAVPLPVPGRAGLAGYGADGVPPVAAPAVTQADQAQAALAGLSAAILDSASLLRHPRRLVQSAITACPAVAASVHNEMAPVEEEPAARAYAESHPLATELARILKAEGEQARKRQLQGHAVQLPDEAAYRRAWNDLQEVAFALTLVLTDPEAINRAHNAANFLRIAWEENIVKIIDTPGLGYEYITDRCVEEPKRRTALQLSPLTTTRAAVAPLADGGWARWDTIRAKQRDFAVMSGHAYEAAARPPAGQGVGAQASATADAAAEAAARTAAAQAQALAAAQTRAATAAAVRSSAAAAAAATAATSAVTAPAPAAVSLAPAAATSPPSPGAATWGATGELAQYGAQLDARYLELGMTPPTGAPFSPYQCMCAACGQFGHSGHSLAAYTGCTASDSARVSKPFLRLATLHKARWGSPATPTAGA